MKKILLNTNLFILFLAPVFVLALLSLFRHNFNLEVPNVQNRIVDLFDKKTIFQILCEIVINQIR